MDRKQLEALEKEQLIEIILMLSGEAKVLTARMAELEARINTNSGNSSKPPSQDGYNKPAPKSLRSKSGKKPGGQSGHKGNGLKLEREPDEIVEHKAEICQNCGADLSSADCVCAKTSNVIDFEIEIKIISHRQMKSVCPECGSVNMVLPPDFVVRKLTCKVPQNSRKGCPQEAEDMAAVGRPMYLDVFYGFVA